jgi:hypothetical protein
MRAIGISDFPQGPILFLRMICVMSTGHGVTEIGVQIQPLSPALHDLGKFPFSGFYIRSYTFSFFT